MKLLLSILLVSIASFTEVVGESESQQQQVDDTVSEKENYNEQPRIIGGTAAPRNRYPYSVSLARKIEKTIFCGATLIASDLVITAAHCAAQRGSLVNINHEFRNDPSSSEEVFNVTMFRRHPDFLDPVFNANDIAIVKFDGQSTANTFVRLNFDANIPSNNQPLTVMGWGTLESGAVDVASVLQEVEVLSLSNEQCRNDFGYSQSQITDDFICALEDGEGACKGDSGGPLIVKGNTPNQDSQVGIVSWGTGCAIRNFPGVYARVSYNQLWIRSTVCEMSLNPPSYFDCDGLPTPSPTPPAPTTNVLVRFRLSSLPNQVGWRIVGESGIVQQRARGFYSNGAPGQIMEEVVQLKLGKRFTFDILGLEFASGNCCQSGIEVAAVYLGDVEDDTQYIAYTTCVGNIELPFVTAPEGIIEGPSSLVPETREFSVITSTDQFPQETRWDVVDLETQDTVWSTDFGHFDSQLTLHTDVVELSMCRSYSLIVYDRSSDGLCKFVRDRNTSHLYPFSILLSIRYLASHHL